MKFFLTYLSVILVVLGAVPTCSSPLDSYHGMANMIQYALQNQQLGEIIDTIQFDDFIKILRYIETLPQIRDYLTYLDENYFPISAILHGIENYLENQYSDKSKRP